MKRQRFRIKETIATIIADDEFIPVGLQEILCQRRYLEDYIREDCTFCRTLDPYKVPSNAPEIVRRMAEAGAKAGVGPMASVAGAIAEYALRAMKEAGAVHAIVDNGGDIAMILSHPVVVGLYAGKAQVRNIGLRFQPHQGLVGICTSSATVGPSLSLGKADAATVISKNVILADAVATALGNAIRSKDRKVIEEAMNLHMRDEIEGMAVIINDMMGICGQILEIVKANVDYELITKG